MSYSSNVIFIYDLPPIVVICGTQFCMWNPTEELFLLQASRHQRILLNNWNVFALCFTGIEWEACLSQHLHPLELKSHELHMVNLMFVLHEVPRYLHIVNVWTTIKNKRDLHTMYVFDHVDAEAVTGDGGEHLPGAPPPWQVVGGAPRGDGTEQKLQVVLLSQLLCWRHEGAELHQNLCEWSAEK